LQAGFYQVYLEKFVFDQEFRWDIHFVTTERPVQQKKGGAQR
jgi:hypothetical protein